MFLYKFKSKSEVNVNLSKYRIDWSTPPSKEQGILENFLYPFVKHKFVLREFRIPGSLYRFDLVVVDNRWIFEYSPTSTHDVNKYFFPTHSSYLKRIKTDLDKIEWAKLNNFKLCEINKEDLPHLSKRYFLDTFDILL